MSRSFSSDMVKHEQLSNFEAWPSNENNQNYNVNILDIFDSYFSRIESDFFFCIA